MAESQTINADQGLEKYFFRASGEDFEKIPGNAIAYWLTPKMLSIFGTYPSLSDHSAIREGINTGDNERFLRRWHEVSANKFCRPSQIGSLSKLKWFGHRKGGEFRKWFGNLDYVVNWQNEGQDIHQFHSLPLDYNGAPVRGKAFFFRPALSWSRISSGSFALRYHDAGMTYDSTAPSVFADKKQSLVILGFLNSLIVFHFLQAMSPTLDFRITSLGRLPFIPAASLREQCGDNFPSEKLIFLSRTDWNSYETSWDFTSLPLLSYQPSAISHQQKADNCTLNTEDSIREAYAKLRAHWLEMTLEMQRLEEENNRIFIDAYGLQDELTPEVPLNEITLTCNPHYRYGGDKSEEELEKLLLADTMRELVSFAVGCMFGRYSLDASGLILANQGQGIDDYFRIIEEKRKGKDSHQPLAISYQQSAISNQQIETTFTDGCTLNTDGLSGFEPDTDNAIPMLDGDWFTDDIAERFRKFLRVAFGEEHYEANLKFVEQGLNIKGKRNYSIRDYFLGEFYTDHVKRYKKRPIYWLFSSPKGSFNALIYMHRYRPDTVSVVLNDYLREFRTKLSSHKNHLEAVSISASAGQGEKTKALKEIEKITKVIAEMEEYEREVLYPLALEQIAIDLDDGVKVNYLKFGAALKKIPGLDAKGED